MCLRPLACLDWGFASCRGHGCVSLVSVVCCQEEVTESGWSLVQRSPIDCGVTVGDSEASIMKTSGQERGYCAMKKRKDCTHTRMWFTLSRNKTLRMKGKSFLELFRWTREPLQHVTGITEIDSQVINKLMSKRGTNLSSCEKHECFNFS
jgi:hypothetical protein